jgi:hypothetical protein
MYGSRFHHFSTDLTVSDGNPLRGFITYSAHTSPLSFPLAMEYNYFSLKDAMLSASSFSWTALESELASVATRHAAIQLYFRYPTR